MKDSKRIKNDAKRIKRAFITAYIAHIIAATFLLGVTAYILFATFSYFARG